MSFGSACRWPQPTQIGLNWHMILPAQLTQSRVFRLLTALAGFGVGIGCCVTVRSTLPGRIIWIPDPFAGKTIRCRTKCLSPSLVELNRLWRGAKCLLEILMDRFIVWTWTMVAWFGKARIRVALVPRSWWWAMSWSLRQFPVV